MKNQRHILRAGAVIASLALAAGCMPKSAQFTGVAPQKRNEVQLVRLTHPVNFNASTGEMLPGEAARIDSFLDSIRLGYGDAVSLDVGDGTVPANRWRAVNAHLNQRGVWLEDRAPISGAAPQAGSAVLVVDRYVVSAPNCGDWGQNLTHNWSNGQSPNFGCSTTTLLGLMVANPRDLIHGQPDSGPVGESATSAIVRGRTERGTSLSLGIRLSNVEALGRGSRNQ